MIENKIRDCDDPGHYSEWATIGVSIKDAETLLVVARLYLNACNNDPELEYQTLPEAMFLTDVREAVERVKGLL